MKKDNYDFGERLTEKGKAGKELEVWVTPKYTASRNKAIEIIEKYDDIDDGDFWILKNETRNGKMAYTGLIISHNACLKINDHLPVEKRFKPECVFVDKEGYNNSLVYTYSCPEQGIFEVGEVSKENCKNAYPHAMALKRCMDRVILKACKLAYNGVYSDSEADEFKGPLSPSETSTEPQKGKTVIKAKGTSEIKPAYDRQKLAKDLLVAGAKVNMDANAITRMLKVESLEELSDERLLKGIEYFNALYEEYMEDEK